jgi:hypothetical protein
MSQPCRRLHGCAFLPPVRGAIPKAGAGIACWCVAVLIPVAAALAGCGSASTDSVGTGAPQQIGAATRTPFVVPTLAIPPGVSRRAGCGLHLAAPVSGAASASDPTVLRDQQGLLNSAQLADPRFYPPGFHWLIVADLTPADVLSAHLVNVVNSGVAVDVAFTPGGAAAFRRVAQAALSAPQGSPANRIAVFSGRDVVWAPGVISPPTGNETEVTGGFTLAQAAQIAVDIAPG